MIYLQIEVFFGLILDRKISMKKSEKKKMFSTLNDPIGTRQSLGLKKASLKKFNGLDDSLSQSSVIQKK